ncbi:hypothetical protein [Halobacillus karajensis]|uniref:hypothetical protein n=1 Tax=Halobacillus karajensis TaxID=195088 RepID=UPI00045D1F2F|nr:hypothetical protein [Halobacillus karajensis]CDQ17970.1 hypothetical protein BN982_00210 [Halobacillus karajensis]
MEIKLKIEAEGLESAIHTLAQVLGNFEYPVDLPKGQPDVPTEESTPEKETKVDTAPAKEKKTQPEPAPEPDKKKDTAPKVSMETVRAKLADLAREGKQEDVKNLISSFDAKKLSEVPEDKFGELLAKAEEL